MDSRLSRIFPVTNTPILPWRPTISPDAATGKPGGSYADRGNSSRESPAWRVEEEKVARFGNRPPTTTAVAATDSISGSRVAGAWSISPTQQYDTLWSSGWGDGGYKRSYISFPPRKRKSVTVSGDDKNPLSSLDKHDRTSMDSEVSPDPGVGKDRDEECHMNNLLEIMNRFAEQTSMQGIPYIRSSTTMVAKLIWSTFFLLCLFLLTGHLYYLFGVYYSYPKHSTIKLGFSPLQFPAVTFCNVNPIKKSMLDNAPNALVHLVSLTEPEYIAEKMKANQNIDVDTMEEEAAKTRRKRHANDKGGGGGGKKRGGKGGGGKSEEQRGPNQKPGNGKGKGPGDKPTPSDKERQGNANNEKSNNDKHSHDHDHSQGQSGGNGKGQGQSEGNSNGQGQSRGNDKGQGQGQGNGNGQGENRGRGSSDSNNNERGQGQEHGQGHGHGEDGGGTGGEETRTATTTTSNSNQDGGGGGTDYGANDESDGAGSQGNGEGYADPEKKKKKKKKEIQFLNGIDLQIDFAAVSKREKGGRGKEGKGQTGRKEGEGEYTGPGESGDAPGRVKATAEGTPFTEPSPSAHIREEFLLLYNSIEPQPRKEAGHQVEDMMIDCSFAERRCHPQNFSQLSSNVFGNCFTIDFQSMVSNRGGYKGGLSLQLFLESEEYIRGITASTGIQVIIHPHGTMPFPEEDGLAVMAGTETNIALRRSNINRLGEPHGTCQKGETFKEKYKHTYSRRACQKFCHHSTLMSTCQCYDQLDGQYVHDILEANLRPCNTIEENNCMVDVHNKYQAGIILCDCDNPCYEETFQKTVSMRQWPADEYTQVLVEALCSQHDDEQCALFKDADPRNIAQSFVKINIYYEDLNYENITEVESYELVQFASDVGGTVGLWLGMSILSGVELLQVFLEVIVYFATFGCCRERWKAARRQQQSEESGCPRRRSSLESATTSFNEY